MTVTRLLGFLDLESWPPETLANQVGDIEELENIETKLATFA